MNTATSMSYTQLKRGLLAGTIADIPPGNVPEAFRDEWSRLTPADRVARWMENDRRAQATATPISFREMGF